MRGTTENQIKILSKKIIHSYFCENRLDFLFSLLAADVYYIILAPAKTCRQREEKNCSFS